MEDPLLIVNLMKSLFDLNPENIASGDNFTLDCSSISDGNSRVLTDERVKHLFLSHSLCDFVRYEWLYSPIDREMFLNSNDFQIILRENFRSLKARRLTRAQWNCIRRIIGKPRRFSHSFTEEERRTINAKRQNLRFLQKCLKCPQLCRPNISAILGVLNTFADTVHIPLRLTRGATVCASVVSPNRGLFLGTIQSSSNEDTCYDIIFEKPLLANSQLPVDGSTQTSLSVYTVPDEDIFLIDPPSPPSISVCAARTYFLSDGRSEIQDPVIQHAFSEGEFNITGNVDRTTSASNTLDKCMPTACRLATHESSLSPTFQPMDEFAGEVDMSNFIISLAKSYRILYQKEKAVAILKEMNDKVESSKSEDDSLITADFQHEYATLVLHLDELNRQLRYHIDVVLLHITKIAADYGMPNIACLTDWRRRCEDEAFEMVNRLKTAQGRAIIEESKSVLIAKLTSILTLLAVYFT
uniref:Protein lin-9 homolog n=1 Tax=Schistocephalus solidus TaxID=70667 RepID=A0A0X3QBM3_SCHSO